MRWRFAHLISQELFVEALQSHDAREAIGELAGEAARSTGIPKGEVVEAVWRRERIMSTALECGVAVPHARLPGLADPLIVIGISDSGVQFHARNDINCRILILILTPPENSDAQVTILSDIARLLRDTRSRKRLFDARGFRRFLKVAKHTL